MPSPQENLDQLQQNWSSLLGILQEQIEDPESDPAEVEQLVETFEDITKLIAESIGPKGEVLRALADVTIGAHYVQSRKKKDGLKRIKSAVDLMAISTDQGDKTALTDTIASGLRALLLGENIEEAKELLTYIEKCLPLDTPDAVEFLILGFAIYALEDTGEKKMRYLEKAYELATADPTGDSLLRVAETFYFSAEDPESFGPVHNILVEDIIPAFESLYSTPLENTELSDPDEIDFIGDRAIVRCQDFQTGNATPYPLAMVKLFVADLLVRMERFDEALEKYRELEGIIERLEVLGEALPVESFPDEDEGWESDIWDETSEGGDYDPYDDEDPDEEFDPESIEDDEEYTEVIGVFTDDVTGRVYTEQLDEFSGNDAAEEEELMRAILRFDSSMDLDNLFANFINGKAITAHMLGGMQNDRKLLEEALEGYEQIIEMITEDGYPLEVEEFVSKADMVRKQLEMLG